MSKVEIAKNTLEEILESPAQSGGLKDAAKVVIDAQDPEGLEILAVVLELAPDPELLAPLWALAENEEAKRAPRSFALQGIASVLVSARIALERDVEHNFLGQADLDQHLERLMGLYRDKKLDPALRRRALEMAANAARTDEIIKAGEAALENEDALWAATGLFVSRIVQPDRARQLVEKALEHGAAEVRYEAIAGLTELGGDEDYDRLKDFIYDGTADERSAALWALADLPGERAGDALVEATRWLQGAALLEAQEANAEWIEQWSALVASGEEPETRTTRVVSSRRSLDRYLSDDFLGDD